MWPYSEHEARWLSGEEIRIEDITPEMIERDLERARKLRAEFITRGAVALSDRIGNAMKSAMNRLAGRASGHGQTT